MIHQPSGGTQGMASDVEIQYKELQYWKETLTDIYVKHTGQPRDTVAKDMDRDFYMSAKEAIGYGLADSIVEGR